MLLLYVIALVHFGPVRATLTFEKAGWLDRMVAYHKKMFLADVQKVLPPEPINASLVPMPPGYVDAPGWDYDSVMRLISLVHASDSAKPVKVAIRRALEPTRRLYISKGRNTFKLFPSLSKKIPNDVYYDINSLEYYADDILPDQYNFTNEDAIVMVANPVEARLPSAQISIKLLKEIMEMRAEANREMPSTTKSTFLWKSKKTKKTKPTSEGTTDGTTNDQEQEPTTAGAGGGGGGGGGATTDPGAEGGDADPEPTTPEPAPEQ